MKKYLLILFLVVLIIPSVALASWWNPFSWKIFHKKEVTPQAQVETQKTSEEKISDLQKQIDDLKKSQPNTSKTDTKINDVKIDNTKTTTESKTNSNYLLAQAGTSFCISNYEKYINLFKQYSDFFSDREKESLELKPKIDVNIVSSVAKGVNIPNDMWRGLSKLLTDDSEYARSVFEINQNNIEKLSVLLIRAKEYKIQQEKIYYTKETASAEAIKLMDICNNTLDSFSKALDDYSSRFNKYTKENDDIYEKAITMLKDNSNYSYSTQQIQRTTPSVKFSTICTSFKSLGITTMTCN